MKDGEVPRRPGMINWAWRARPFETDLVVAHFWSEAMKVKRLLDWVVDDDNVVKWSE